MRLSQLFTKTSKTAPAGESAKNAKLLIQAGFIYKEMAGVYAYLPLGFRVVENIKAIVREEMNALGSHELIMTSLQRKEVWDQTGRWDDEVVDVWFKSSLKNGSEVGLAWSHEEQITEMMKNYLSSYRDMPISLYQFQTKLRNEVRSKSGIMRGREFVMKDLYAYSRTEEELQEFYDKVSDAYLRVYDRVGLGDVTFVTFASGGAFTQYSHEFQTVTDAGEDIIFRVPSTGVTYNEEIAPAKSPSVASDKKMKPMEEVEGKGLIGVEPLAKFLGISVEDTTKTMLYVTETGQIVAAAVRGLYKINEQKLRAVVGAKSLTLADEATVKRVTGAEVGYAGILGLPEEVRIIVDGSCANRTNFEMGANHTNYHSINVNWGRDLPEPEQYYDIKIARKGDMHPGTGEVYNVFKAAEVGNIFNFGTEKSEQMGLYYTDENAKQQPVYLSSYGLGVTRLMGVVAEHFADEKGLVWPEAIAPALIYIARLGDDPAVIKAADELYNALTSRSVLVLYDDRDIRAGEKFADADLTGIPYRVVVSAKLAGNGQLELKARTGSETRMTTADELVTHARSGTLAELAAPSAD